MIYTGPALTRVEDFDQDGLLKLSALLKIFENTSIRHAEQAGISPMEQSLHGGIVWVFTDWRAELLRAPGYGDAIYASTWVHCSGRGRVSREMLLKDADGAVLARGQGRLAFIDTAAGRPLLPTPESLAVYRPEESTAFPDRLPKLRTPSAFTAEAAVPLRRSDMDYNGHLHNTAYLDLALELLPRDILDEGIRACRISYRSPLRYGDPLTLRGAPKDGGWTTAFCREGEVCALVAVNERLSPL